MTNRVRDIDRWAKRLPLWVRPVVYGAGFVYALLGARGAFVILPIAAVVVLFVSPHPLHELRTIEAMFGLAVLGGALGGLSYSLLGRWARHIPVLGPALAGMLTIAPYMAAGVIIVRINKGEPVWAPLDRADVVIVLGLSALYGGLLGQGLFGPNRQRTDAAPPVREREGRARNLVLRFLPGVVSVMGLVLSLPWLVDGGRSLALLLVLVPAVLWGIWWSFPRNRAEVEQFRLNSDERIEKMQRLVAIAGTDRLDCPCCGYPSVSGPGAECVLCGWPDADVVSLAEAQANFRDHGSIYSSTHRPAWKPRLPDEVELEAIDELVAAYEAYRAAGAEEKLVCWLDVVETEEHLHEIRLRSPDAVR